MRLTGLHSKIALRLALLLMAAMVMIDLAVFTGAERAMVRDRVDAGRRYLEAWRSASRSPFPTAAAAGGALALVRLDGRLEPYESLGDAPVRLDAEQRERLHDGREVVAFNGRSWGVFWHQPRWLLLAVPETGPGAGAVAGVWPLDPVYRELRRLQPLMAGYMLVNLILLELAGVYLIGRITVRPLQRLVRRAETFTDEADLFAVAGADDQDYARLSRALSRLFGGVQRDREALARSVERLEAANRRLQQAHDEVLRAEKLAAVGRLSAGLAHEIGNPLGIVGGYLELLRRPRIPAEEHKDIVARAKTEIDRIGRILRQLLDLARPERQEESCFRIHPLIRETGQIFEHQPLTAGIDWNLRLEADRDRVRGDPERLRQVFLNLMINAADAIRESGVGHGRLEILTAVREESIRITFADDGAGIAPEHLGLVFDPFFTTKATGKGTGLGLAVSFMIVQALGGRMEVESAPGTGTRMHVTLPLARD